jgi:hypothetical protein
MAVTVDRAPTEDAYITENSPGTAGAPVGSKYLLLEVPDCTNQGPSSNQQINSALCLGSVAGWPSGAQYGNDLAALVQGFTDDDRFSTGDNPPANQLLPAQTGGPNGGITPGSDYASSHLTTTEAESAILHTKGGWRDHTEGNRITTTRGDKVEVIQGNYKLIVLGRRPATWPNGWTAGAAPTLDMAPIPGTAAGWDVSGGLVDTNVADLNFLATPIYDPTIAANASSAGVNSNPNEVGRDQIALSTEYVWEANSDGNWGWTLINTTGQFATSPGAGNGKTVSYTWVDEIWTMIGSPEPQKPTAKPFDKPTTGTITPDTWVTTNPVPVTHPVKKICQRTFGETILSEVRATTAEAQIADNAQIALSQWEAAHPRPVPPHGPWVDLRPGESPPLGTTVTRGPSGRDGYYLPPTPAQTAAYNAAMTAWTAGFTPLQSALTTAQANLAKVPSTLVVNSVSDGTLNVLNSANGNLQQVVQTTPGSGGTLTSQLHSDGTLFNNLSSNGALHNHTTSSDMIDEYFSARSIHNLMDMCGLMRSEIDLAALMISEIKAALLIPEVKLGIHMDTHLGMHLDAHYGLHLENHVGFHLQQRMIGAASSEVYIATHGVGQFLGAMIGLGSGPVSADPTPPPAAAAGGAEAAAPAGTLIDPLTAGAAQGANPAWLQPVANVANVADSPGVAGAETGITATETGTQVGADDDTVSNPDDDEAEPGGWEPL